MSTWNPVFSHVPVESIVYEHQSEYYRVLKQSTVNGESSVFIEFMLGVIHDAIKGLFTPEDTPDVTPEVRRMLLVMDGEMTRKQIQEKLGLRDEKHFRESYQQPAVASGFIEMTLPDKPKSPLQKYRITAKGSALIKVGKKV